MITNSVQKVITNRVQKVITNSVQNKKSKGKKPKTRAEQTWTSKKLEYEQVLWRSGYPLQTGHIYRVLFVVFVKKGKILRPLGD